VAPGEEIFYGSGASDRILARNESLAPSYDKMMADHARRLKDELDAAAEFCVEDSSTSIRRRRSTCTSPAAGGLARAEGRGVRRYFGQPK
jgi:hypothetical protein